MPEFDFSYHKPSQEQVERAAGLLRKAMERIKPTDSTMTKIRKLLFLATLYIFKWTVIGTYKATRLLDRAIAIIKAVVSKAGNLLGTATSSFLNLAQRIISKVIGVVRGPGSRQDGFGEVKQEISERLHDKTSAMLRKLAKMTSRVLSGKLSKWLLECADEMSRGKVEKAKIKLEKALVFVRSHKLEIGGIAGSIAGTIALIIKLTIPIRARRKAAKALKLAEELAKQAEIKKHEAAKALIKKTVELARKRGGGRAMGFSKASAQKKSMLQRIGVLNELSGLVREKRIKAREAMRSVPKELPWE
jgi:hypothetical protein